ncbi:hypothetical protein HDU87_001991 [Geranomyces variabilis]|uniref:Uncharacterized protein n=1 Tax=Geranomyces variabilis TaxID=109894 RepID=A0AAD5TMD1_9FUNG|nr:hypothetical protein HDU87_001991 [Geranomyces variabilis]
MLPANNHSSNEEAAPLLPAAATPPAPAATPASAASRKRQFVAKLALIWLGIGAILAAAFWATRRHDASDPSRQTGPLAPWKSCFNKTEGLLCSTLTVPLVHGPASTKDGNNDSRTLEIALIKRPGSAPGAAANSIFFNPGGPGGSGVNMIQRMGSKLAIVLENKFDLISFDPRGVGASSVVNCFASPTQQSHMMAAFSLLLEPFAGDDQMAALRLAADSVVVAGCETHSGWLLPYVTTSAVARDMDLLREAMGLEEMRYWGFSYGTQLGTVYANMFPDRVGRMVLDGAVDPVMWMGHRKDDSLMDAEAEIDALGQLCSAAGPDRCALANATTTSSETVSKLIRDYISKLRLTPIAVTTGDNPGLLTSTYVANAVFVSLYKPRDFAKVAAALKLAIVDSDPRELYALAAPPPFDDVEVDSEMLSNMAVRCGDRSGPASPRLTAEDVLKEIKRNAKLSPLTGALWSWSASPCVAWNVTVHEPYEGPWNASTKNKLLIIGNDLDPVTPGAHAERLAGLFTARSARFLRHKGLGHCSLAQGSLCTIKNIRRYFAVDGRGADDVEDDSCLVDEDLFPGAVSALRLDQDEQRVLDAIKAVGDGIQVRPWGV